MIGKRSPYLPRCSWNMLQLWGSLTLPLEAGRTHQRVVGFSVLIVLTNLWKLYAATRRSLFTTTYSTSWRLGVLKESSKVTHHFYSVWVACSHSLISGTHGSSLSHRPSTFELCELLVSLSRTHNTSKLCRWLAGVFRESLHPYFIRSTFLRSYFFLFSSCTYIITWFVRKSQVFIMVFFIIFFASLRLHLIISHYSHLSSGAR